MLQLNDTVIARQTAYDFTRSPTGSLQICRGKFRHCSETLRVAEHADRYCDCDQEGTEMLFDCHQSVVSYSTLESPPGLLPATQYCTLKQDITRPEAHSQLPAPPVIVPGTPILVCHKASKLSLIAATSFVVNKPQIPDASAVQHVKMQH